MANREAEYYLARAQDIRRRGGSEELARQMENYANNLAAGIYNDTTPAWTPPTPTAARTSGQRSSTGRSNSGQGGSRQAPPVQHVISPNQEQALGVLPQRGSYMDYPNAPQFVPSYNNNVADFKRLNDTNTPAPAPRQEYDVDTYRAEPQIAPSTNNVADFKRLNDTNTPPQRQEYDVDTYRGDNGPQRHSGLLGWLENFQLGNVANAVRTNNSAADGILPQRDSYMNISAPSNNNIADFKRLNDTNNIPVIDLGTSPIGMVAEAEKPIQYANKPSGHRELTQFYAQQLKGSGYERNEGKDGIHYGDNGLVNRMRDLRGIIPYDESDGTNCARTVSVALDGTPYSGMFNVDEIVNKARANGQLINPASGYVPQAGDLAVTNGGDHVVMVTENGGVIQNGKSHNGVYETTKPPTEQKGGVKYYVRTSDYNNAFPSFHADLSLGEWNFDNPFDVK